MRRSDMIEILESRSPISAEELRLLCIEKDWFTHGTNQQYQKLFDMNRDGASLEELALVIWICSSNDSREAILHELNRRYGGVA